MKIIVTGGAGFIGSHVAEAFLGMGHEVLILDDLSRGKESNMPRGALFDRIDIAEAALVGQGRESPLQRLFKSWKPEVVSHHAAQISVRDSVSDPYHDVRTNAEGTLRLLEACRANGVNYFIFASTGGALYGEQQHFPARENHPTYPLSPYGISKLASEKYLFFYCRQYGLKGMTLRYANVYGPRQDPYGEAGVVAIFCAKLRDGQTPTINGDGGQTRDFVYVGDVARANALALETLAGAHRHATAQNEINISTGLETDVNELARIIAQIAGSNIEFQHGPPMPGEQRRSVLEPSLALEVLRWKPEISIVEGLKITWEYFKTQG